MKKFSYYYNLSMLCPKIFIYYIIFKILNIKGSGEVGFGKSDLII